MSIRANSVFLCGALLLALAGWSDVVRAQPMRAPEPSGEIVTDVITPELAAIKSVPELLSRGNVAAAKEDWATYGAVMRRVAQLRPYAGNIQLEIAASHALRNDKTGGYNVLMPLPVQGYGFDLDGDPRFKNIEGTQVWNYLLEQFGNNRKVAGSGDVFATLPKQDLLIESLAWNPLSNSLLVGSVRTGKVSRVDASGKLVDFIVPDKANGLGGVFDLAVDAKRKVLWVATAQVPHARHSDVARHGDAALVKFDLATGTLIQRLPIPADDSPHLPTGMVVAPDGALFVADTVQPLIWKVEGNSLRAVVRNPNLTGIRAITMNDRGTVLYLADHELGVFGFDLASGKAFLLSGPPTLTMYSVDALGWHNGNLIMMQNGFPPARVVRLALDESGRKIVNSQILDSGHEAFGMPGNGVVGGDAFYLIANSQRHLVDGTGKLTSPQSLEGVRIFRSDLGAPMPEPPPLPASLRGLPKPG